MSVEQTHEKGRAVSVGSDALLGVLREIAKEMRECESQCIHAPKAKAMYAQRAEQIESAIAGVERMGLAHREAVRLASSMWRRSYRETAPNWQPLDDTAGVISQIDNMHAGVVQDLEDAYRQWNEALDTGLNVVKERDAYRAELERLQKKVGADDHVRIWELLNARPSSPNGRSEPTQPPTSDHH